MMTHLNFWTQALDAVVASIEPVPAAAVAQVQLRLDQKTKPRGSLGRLETLACRFAAARRREGGEPLRKAIVVMAGDHGVARAGVSAFPQEVTGQMVLNFASGGAAINVLARRADATLWVVDMGIVTPVAGSGIRSIRIGPGTRNFLEEPAMAPEQALHAIGAGVALAQELAHDGHNLIGLGEMGIGNTTSASALLAALLNESPRVVTGRGTGVDNAIFERKLAVISQALETHRPSAQDPLDVLAKLGGFEIAGLTGLVLGAASRRIPVLVDGLITSAAALLAARLRPAVTDYLIAAHRSVEPGHQKTLDALNLQPLFDLEMRLGEGSGAALAMPLVEASLAILDEMATFASAGVSDSGA